MVARKLLGTATGPMRDYTGLNLTRGRDTIERLQGGWFGTTSLMSRANDRADSRVIL